MPEGLSDGAAVRQVQPAPRGGTPGFTWPAAVPWSELGEEFVEAYGHDGNGRLRAEHMEVMGQSGSGKSYAIATILQQRAQRWDTAELAVLTKRADDSLPLLGWPVIDSVRDLSRYRQALYWPRTDAQGEAREEYHEERIYELLARLWQPDANVLLYFDEVRYIEQLSRRLRKQVRMYWREGRSHGISLIAGAQRPLEMVRDQHSESRWKLVFPPADLGDMRRFAEMLGRPPDWQPVLESLDQESHQFVLRNTFSRDSYITWIDRELRPVQSQADQKDRSVPQHISGRRALQSSRGDQLCRPGSSSRARLISMSITSAFRSSRPTISMTTRNARRSSPS